MHTRTANAMLQSLETARKDGHTPDAETAPEKHNSSTMASQLMSPYLSGQPPRRARAVNNVKWVPTAGDQTLSSTRSAAAA
jgi:hypothetical protein